jgi:hypothetical protein
MLQTIGKHPPLADKTLAQELHMLGLRGKHLQRTSGPKRHILGLIYLAHSTGAKLSNDPIRAYALSRLKDIPAAYGNALLLLSFGQAIVGIAFHFTCYWPTTFSRVAGTDMAFPF